MGESSLAALQKAAKFVPPDAAEEGEYTLVLSKLLEKKDKNAEDVIIAICKIEGRPDAKDIFVNLSLPSVDGSGDYDDLRSEIIQKFAHTFGIDDITVLATDPSAVIGNTGKVHLTTEEYEGATVNRVKTWL